jgi:hypothetical protein
MKINIFRSDFILKYATVLKAIYKGRKTKKKYKGLKIILITKTMVE